MAATLDLEIEQGATFMQDLNVVDIDDEPIDLTGYTASLSIKAALGDTVSLLDMTTSNGRISIAALTGVVSLLIDDETTSALDWTRGVYVLELTNGAGDVSRLFEGAVTVSIK